MSKKLIYFNTNGLGEFIRYMLHYGGQKFEDERIQKWPLGELKHNFPYGQLPVYEEGDRRLNQSIAIARYVGSQVGLVPADPWEQAVLDATVLNINDFRMKMYPIFSEQDNDKKEKLKTEFLTETVEYYFSRFEKELKNNNGHFGGKLSWADFYFVGIIESINHVFKAEIEKNYPTITSLMNEIVSLPGVKEYIAVRKPYVHLPYGQLPVYEEGDRRLNQSIAIARYVGSQVGLVPADPWEQAVLDAAVLNVNDFRLKMYPAFLEQDKEKKEKLRQEFLTETVEYFFSRFEKELKNNNGHFGKKLSWADFFLVGVIEAINLIMNAEVQKNYPTVAALVKEIWSLPGVKEYIAKREPYVFNQ